ncbi:MAG: DUF1206 domain-containing protein [Jatrophihabitantaceae bacterium]
MTTVSAARQAARSEPVKHLGRLGFAARAVIYLLIGWFAFLLATGNQPPEADQRGAMQELTRHTGGFLLLWALAIGLSGYALWRWSEAAFGVVGEGRDWKPRLQSAIRGTIYAFFAVSAFNLLAHARAQSQAGQTELFTARAMQHTGGRVVVGIVGAIVVIAGLALVFEGLTRKFKKYFDLAEMPTGSRRLVWILGTVGTTARGIAFALTGYFVLRAAWNYQPDKARGLDGALRTVASSDSGRWLVGVVGLGMVAFGLYGFAEARWRRT